MRLPKKQVENLVRVLQSKTRNKGFSSFYKPFAVFGCTALGLLAYFQFERTRLERAKMEMIQNTKGSVGDALIGGEPFSLLDHTNSMCTQENFKGKFMLLYFGFTHCPDICPDELDKMTKIIEELDSIKTTADKTIPIFATVDPQRDTPGVLNTYLKDFSPKMVGLTGTPDQMLDFAKQHRVYCSVNSLTDTKDYLIDHSVFFYLMGPDGKFLDFFGREMSASQVATKISEWIRVLRV